MVEEEEEEKRGFCFVWKWGSCFIDKNEIREWGEEEENGGLSVEMGAE